MTSEAVCPAPGVTLPPAPCSLCPRQCHALRRPYHGVGFCRMGSLPVVARAAPHFGEEPVISGTRGSGAIFFAGCGLGCDFCQNSAISHERQGQALTVPELAACMRRLVDSGVHNLNLVTAGHFAPQVRQALLLLRQGATRPPVPVVYNCGGYESVETLRLLEDVVDIYLPDFKFADPTLAARHANALDYPEVATSALREMLRQKGGLQVEAGLAVKGVLVRHLVLPGGVENSIRVLRHLCDTFGEGLWLALMAQYTPWGNLAPPMDRAVTQTEYDAVREVAQALFYHGFTQEITSAGRDQTPAFDGSGVERA